MRNSRNCGAEGADQETFRSGSWRTTHATRWYPDRVAIKEAVGFLKQEGDGGRTLREELVHHDRQKAGGHGRKLGRGELGGSMTDQAAITAAVFCTQAAAEIQTIDGDRQAQQKPDQ